MLAGVRVVEIADELGEYVGLLLAGLGADVVKIEDPAGSGTRRIGPFLNDEEDPENSLFFWHHNRGKRSVVCDLSEQEGKDRALRLIASADILLDTSCGQLEEHPELTREALAAKHPALVMARILGHGRSGRVRTLCISPLGGS
jgi:crotonobetainyl-CoA:carnitine CoA-transferase CaiB-like acyl-CoA transferase